MSILQSWDALLQEEFQKEYYMALQSRLDREYEQYTVYPPREYLYEAFMQAPWEQVKVVILGQDPYHGYGQAHGLCFSVPAGVQIPPSLRNIYQELHTDLGFAIPNHGDLHKWARQGVLLLNTTFSVRDGEANSHKGFGWERLTDEVIRQISEQKENVVFILWGKPAQQKAKGIDASKHLVLMAPHPSPLSSYRGFFGSKPFSKTNSYLEAHGMRAIDWEIEMC